VNGELCGSVRTGACRLAHLLASRYSESLQVSQLLIWLEMIRVGVGTMAGSLDLKAGLAAVLLRH